MNRKARKMNRKTQKAKPIAAKSDTRTSYLWRWTPVILLLLVTSLAIVFQRIHADTNKVTASQPQPQQSVKIKPTPAPETEVLAYFDEKNDWRPTLLKELDKGQEFQLDDHLCYLDQYGFIQVNPGVNITLLSESDRYFEEGSSRFPESKDVVRFIDQDHNHLRHDRMGRS